MTHTRLTALCPGLPRWASTRKVKPIWILLKQETVNGSGISWAICKSAHRLRQITTPAPHHSVFYRPDALPAAQPTVSKHWRHIFTYLLKYICFMFSAPPCSFGCNAPGFIRWFWCCIGLLTQLSYLLFPYYFTSLRIYFFENKPIPFAGRCHKEYLNLALVFVVMYLVTDTCLLFVGFSFSVLSQ